MAEPVGKYLRDICPKCGGHLVEQDGMHFFDTAKAILFMEFEKCGIETFDIGLSRNWKFQQNLIAKQKAEELQKRRISLF